MQAHQSSFKGRPAMNTNFSAPSTIAATDASVISSRADAATTSQAVESDRAPRSLVPALLAFFTTVFASMAAAAAVVSNDLALMVVGL